MNLLSSLVCFVIVLNVTPASSQYLIRLTIGVENQTLSEYSDGEMEKVVMSVNHWFREYNVHIQWVNLITIPDRPLSTLHEVFNHWKQINIPGAEDSNDFIQIWTDKKVGGSEYHETIPGTFCQKGPSFGVVSVVKGTVNAWLGRKLNDLVTRRSIMSFLTSMGLMEHQQHKCSCPPDYLGANPCIIKSDADNDQVEAPDCFEALIKEALKNENCSKPDLTSRSYRPICQNGIKEEGEGCDCFRFDEECRKCCIMSRYECKKKTSNYCRPTTLAPSTTASTTLRTTEATKPVTKRITLAVKTTPKSTTAATIGARKRTKTLAIVISVSAIGLLLSGLCLLYFLSRGKFLKTKSRSVDKGTPSLQLVRSRSQDALSLPLAPESPSVTSATRHPRRSRNRRNSWKSNKRTELLNG